MITKNIGWLLASGCLLSTFSLVAEDKSVEWVQGAASMGGGAVTAQYDASGFVTSLVANPDCGDRLTLTGSDAIVFAADATLSLGVAGTLAIAAPVETKGRLNVNRSDGGFVLEWVGNSGGTAGDKSHAFLPKSADNAFTLFTADRLNGAALDDLVVIGSQLNKNHTQAKGYSGVLKPGAIGSIVASGTTKTRRYSLNRYDSSLKCTFGMRVQLRLLASGDLQAIVEYGGHTSSDVDVAAEGDLYAMRTATPQTAKDDYWIADDKALSDSSASKVLGLDHLRIFNRKARAATVRFEGAATFGGETDVGVGSTAVIVGAGDFATSVGGSGEIRFEPSGDAACETEAFAAWLATTNSSSWSVVATNRSLANLVAARATLQGTACPGSQTVTAYNLANDGTNAVCQFQTRSGDLIRDANVRFRQSGPHVEAQLFSAFYVYENAYGSYPTLGADFLKDYDSWPSSTASHNPAKSTRTLATGPKGTSFDGMFGLRNLEFDFKGGAKTTLTGPNYMTADDETSERPKLTFAGTSERVLDVAVKSNKAFPSNGVITVAARADVRLAAAGASVHSGYSDDWQKKPSYSTIRVQSGGVLHQGSQKLLGTIGRRQSVELSGGTLLCEGGTDAKADFYLTSLTLDGARIAGKPPQTGHALGTSTWNVTGTLPSFVDSGVCVVGGTRGSAESVARRLVMDVADVTGDAATDCTLAEFVPYDSTESYAYFGFFKKGAGTLAITGDAKAVRTCTEIDGGVLLLGASGIATNDVLLAGGSLAVAGGTSNALGTLKVTEPATITVPDGATLSFAGGSGWSVGERQIVIDANLSRSTVRFGSGPSALTAEQVKMLGVKVGERVYRVSLGADGRLSCAAGLVLVVR